MRRTGQSLLLFIGAASALGAVPKEVTSRKPPPPLNDTHIPDEYVGPTDYAIPSYRVPLLSLHSELVNIFSTTGYEAPPAVALQQLLTDLNYTVELQPLPSHPPGVSGARPRQYNVLAWPGSNATRTSHDRVLLTSHINTLWGEYFPYALNTTYIPRTSHPDFAALSPATRILGRGAVDAKAAIAAQITAATDLVSSGAVAPDSLMLLFRQRPRALGLRDAALLRGPPPLPPPWIL